MSMFPADALSDAFEPAYNKDLDCPLVMYSLAALWEGIGGGMNHCEKCKLTGDKGQPVFPSIVMPASETSRLINPEPVKLVILGEA